MFDRRRSPALFALSTLLLTGIALVNPGPAAAVNAAPLAVPRIQSWSGGTGSTLLTGASRIVVDPADASANTSGVTDPLASEQTLAQTAQRLRDDLEEVTGLDLPVVQAPAPSAGDVFLTLASDAALGVEGYELDVAAAVTVSAPATDGVFYGGQTILQILRQGTASPILPQGVARDWPDLRYRAEHFDVSRRMMSVAEIQDEIRRAAWNKLNVLQLMFNQANAFRLYDPAYAVASPTDPTQRYSQADIEAIEAVAAQYHVTLVPEVQNPTKMQPIATMGGVDRSLAAQCNDTSTVDFTDPTVVAWMQELLVTFASWFDGPYVHLGNDEVPAALGGCSYLTSQLAAGETIDDLQVDYIDALQSTVEGLGKKAMIWVNNTKIMPSTDVLIMNFGPTSVSTTMRGLGYDVVESAYKTGPYDRFYISPSDYEGKVVPRGDIYAWTPVEDPHNAGQVLAMWGDDLFFSETAYFVDMFDGRRSELAERTWASAPPARTFAQFTALVDAVGEAPGSTPVASVPATSDAAPLHAWDFDAPYVPTAATHFPGEWKLSLADQVGTLHGNGWIFRPSYPVAGRFGNGLGFSAAANQSLNLGGLRVQAPWTVSTWIRRTADSTNTVLLRDMDNAIKIEQSGTDHRVGITTYGGASHSFDYTLPLNTWVQLTLVGTPTTTSLYADGEPVQTINASIPLPLGGIGGRRPFGGVLDDLKVYAQALTAQQVHDDYDGAPTEPADLAQGRPATASSVKAAGREAALAVDGDPTTRWGSVYADPQWIQVDLGQVKAIDRVRLSWEAAYGRSYQVQVSDDGSAWTSIYSTTTGDGGVDDLTGLTGQGRYVRVLGTQRGTSYGYSLWDLNVYGG